LAIVQRQRRSRRQIDDGNAEVMSASIAFSAAFSSTAFAGVQNWGPPLNVGSDHPEDYPCKMCGLH